MTEPVTTIEQWRQMQGKRVLIRAPHHTHDGVPVFVEYVNSLGQIIFVTERGIRTYPIDPWQYVCVGEIHSGD